jgi:hypothetical protein
MLSSTDKCGCDSTWCSHMDDFGSCIQAMKMVKVPYSEIRYIWNNG